MDLIKILGIVISFTLLAVAVSGLINTINIDKITVKLTGYEEVCTNTTVDENYVLIDTAIGNCEELCKTECYYTLGWIVYSADADEYIQYGNGWYCSGESWKTNCYGNCVDDGTPHLFFYNETICTETMLKKEL